MVTEEENHELALQRHEAAWNAMHRIGITQGRGSDLYRRAREHVVKARRVVSLAARRAELERGGGGTCPDCGKEFKQLKRHRRLAHNAAHLGEYKSRFLSE